MKSTFNFCIYFGGFDPKNGILGLVPSPPTKTSTVLNKSGAQCANVSHNLKMCIPQVITLLY